MKIKLLVVVLALTSCHKLKREPVSVVNTADSAVSRQLVGGFYKIEAKAWRWTAREFMVSLLPPPDAEQRGAKLDLRLFIPEEHIAKIGPMTLKAEIEDLTLAPETYSTGGSFSYIREIPPNRLKTKPVSVIFTFDKAFHPTGKDGRELGAVVTLISLLPNREHGSD